MVFAIGIEDDNLMSTGSIPTFYGVYLERGDIDESSYFVGMYEKIFSCGGISSDNSLGSSADLCVAVAFHR